MSYTFVPSLFGAFDTFKCPLQLRHAMTPTTAVRTNEDRPLVDYCARGNDYEASLFRALEQCCGPPSVDARVRLRPLLVPNLPDDSDVNVVSIPSWEHFCALLHTSYKVTTTVFVRDLSISAELVAQAAPLDHLRDVRMGQAKPDVVRVTFQSEGPPLVTVIDIKSAPKVKRYHRLQIAMYHRIIDKLLQRNDLRATMDAVGIVWLDGSMMAEQTSQVVKLPTETPSTTQVYAESFDMSPAQKSIDDFCSTVLPIATGDVEEVPWQLRPSCVSCPRLRQCQAKAVHFDWPSDPSADLPDDDILCGVPMVPPTPRHGAQDSPSVEPRGCPILHEHSIIAELQTGAPLTHRCGAPTKKDGEPCKIIVGAAGERCRHHAYRCGAPTKKDGEPCKIIVGAAGERCQYHGSSSVLTHRCGAPTKKDGEPCKIIVGAAGERCRYHIGTHIGGVSVPSQGVEGPTTCPLKSALDGKRAVCCFLWQSGTVVRCVLWRADTNERASSDGTEAEEKKLLAWLEGFCSSEVKRPLVLVYDVAQRKLLSSLIHRNGAVSSAFRLLCDMDFFTFSSGAMQTYQTAAFTMMEPILVCLRETALAHLAWNERRYLKDAALLRPIDLLRFLLPSKYPPDRHTDDGLFRAQETTAAAMARALPDLFGAVEALCGIAIKHNTLRQPPPFRLVVPFESADTTQQSQQAIVAKQMWLSEAAIAARACVKCWLTRRIEGVTPMILKCGKHGESVVSVSQDHMALMGGVYGFSSHGEAIPYLDHLQDAVSPADFRNGSYFALKLPTAPTAGDLVRSMDSFADWNEYDSITRANKATSGTPLVDVINVVRRSELELVLTVVKLQWNRTDDVPLEEGLWVIAPCACDFNFSRLDALKSLPPVQLLSDCIESNDVRSEPLTLGPLVPAGEEQRKFTADQAAFMRSVQENRITILWGPPGTGKTMTLAWLLAKVCSKGSSLIGKNTLVLANTNAALEELFFRLIGLYPNFDIDQINFSGLMPAFTSRRDIPQCFARRRDPFAPITANDSNCARIVFCTTWKCATRKFPSDERFDLLVVDEASQLRVAHALLAARFVSDAAHIVVAGDELQLPPIVPNELQASDVIAHHPQRLLFVGSLLEVLKDKDRAKVVMLRTSYRSVSAIVCLVGALYNDELTPFETNRAVSNSDAITVHVVKDRPTTLADEAHDVIGILRDAYSRRRRSFGVVVPHRRQRRTIVAALQNLPRNESFRMIVNGTSSRPEEDEATIDVDTVERMQGREFGVVLVVLASVAPTAFVLTLQRLNVALSRAQSEVHIVSNKAFLDALARDDTAAARHLMRFVDYASPPSDALRGLR